MKKEKSLLRNVSLAVLAIGMLSVTQPAMAETAVHAGGHGAAHHKSLEVSHKLPIPAIELEITPDPVSGWNLHVISKNFKFAPEHANQNNVPGEGHAHIYVNGKKLTRLYSNYYHMEPLWPGSYEVSVILNGNNHQVYTYNGKPIEASQHIVQK